MLGCLEITLIPILPDLEVCMNWHFAFEYATCSYFVFAALSTLLICRKFGPEYNVE
jgi:hypothetical protein